MYKKEYSRPDLTFERLQLRDVICSSVEDFNSHIDQGGFDSVPDDSGLDEID